LRKHSGDGIVFSHGYCSEANPWENLSLTGSVHKSFFQDFRQSISHDEFANRLRSFADSNYDGCSIIAHSQGGAGALHLYSYFWSCLDYAGTGRLIQSVGTPYQGTPLASSLAVLGDIFGVGCGYNYDLTYSGANAWLRGIPSWARAAVNYYTTSFTDNWWSYNYCQIASDLLLSDPDDGAVEKSKAQLSGAINRGHRTGWCHTDGMRDTAQTKDSSRNTDMINSAA
jgi:S-formylglutathione hydrolase FrmB